MALTHHAVPPAVGTLAALGLLPTRRDRVLAALAERAAIVCGIHLGGLLNREEPCAAAARMICYYLLHREHGWSLRELAARFDRAPSSVTRAISQLTDVVAVPQRNAVLFDQYERTRTYLATHVANLPFDESGA